MATTSIWLRPERGARGPASRWTRSDVARRAVTLADRDGLRGVTMRSLAESLGTAPASLYRVVSSRDELVELMVDEVIGEFEYDSDLTGSGHDGLLRLARQARSCYLRHPWMLDVPPAGPILGPHAVRYLDAAMSTLTAGGDSAQDGFESIGVLSGLVRLLVRNELRQPRSEHESTDTQRAAAHHLAAASSGGAHPHLAAALAAAGEPPPPTELFDRIVGRTLTGLLPRS